MKRFKLLLIVLLVTKLQATSQIVSEDSVTCLPNTQLRKAINIIEHGKVVAKELAIVNQKVTLLEYAVNLKDSTLAQYRIKDNLHNQMVTGYEAAILNYKSILANNEQSLKIQRTMVRRQKLAKWGTFLAGLGGGYLIFR
jgi:hypothetical protein